MNSAKASNHHSSPNFKTVLDTAISYQHLDTLIWECNDVLINSQNDIKKITLATRCRKELINLIESMKMLEVKNDEGLIEEDISEINIVYNNIYKLIEHLRKMPQFIQEVRREVAQITMQPRVGNIYTFPSIETSPVPLSKNPEISSEDTSEDPESIQAIQSKMAAPHIRKQILQRELFGKNGEILSDSLIAKKRQKMIQTLGDDPVSAHIYKWDCLAANDEKFPENELSDHMISQAIRSAKMRKDGAYIQSIKNNLIKNASNDAIFDPTLETSGLLADHMKNLGPSNPITLQTVEYGTMNILSSKTIEHGDATYYHSMVSFGDGTKKHLMLSASAFAVGDLSDKIIGEIDPQGKLVIGHTPCTIRRIRSTQLSKKPNTSTIRERSSAFIQKWFQELKSLFGFGKNK